MVAHFRAKMRQIFNSIGDAERFLGINNAHANIVRQLKGRSKSAYGYFWKYLEEDPDDSNKYSD